MKLGISVFDRAEELSRLLQSKRLPASAAKNAASSLVASLSNSREEQNFDTFWSSSITEANNLCLDAPVMPRRKRIPVRFDSDSEGVNFKQPVDYFRSIYYEFIDGVIGCVRTRFDQETFGVYMKMENLLLDTINDKGKQSDYKYEQEVPSSIAYFSNDLDARRLGNQPLIVAGCAPDENGIEHQVIGKVNSIDDFVAELSKMRPSMRLYTEVNKLIRLLLTIPASSTTAERSFFSLRRLKTYARSTMTAARLNHVAILHVHQDRTDSLEDAETMRSFVAEVDTRSATFGNI